MTEQELMMASLEQISLGEARQNLMERAERAEAQVREHIVRYNGQAVELAKEEAEKARLLDKLKSASCEIATLEGERDRWKHNESAQMNRAIAAEHRLAEAEGLLRKIESIGIDHPVAMAIHAFLATAKLGESSPLWQRTVQMDEDTAKVMEKLLTEPQETHAGKEMPTAEGVSPPGPDASDAVALPDPNRGKVVREPLIEMGCELIHRGIAAIVRREALEEAARIALAEQDRRIKNANAAQAGDTSWGIHTAGAVSIQNHKAVTAGHIAAAIREAKEQKSARNVFRLASLT